MPSNAEKYTEMAIDLTVPLALAGSFSERVAARKAIADALEAVERDTALRCAEMLETNGVMLPIIPGELKCDYVVRFSMAFAAKIRAEFGIAEIAEKETKRG